MIITNWYQKRNKPDDHSSDQLLSSFPRLNEHGAALQTRLLMSFAAVDNFLPTALEQGSLGDWNTFASEHRLVHDDRTREEDSVAEELTTMVGHHYHITRDQLRREDLERSS